MNKLSRIAVFAAVCLAVTSAVSTASAAEITAEGQAQLEADWLMQCENKPTVKRISDEIVWGRQLAARLTKLKGCKSLKAPLDTLTQLEKQVAGAKTPEAIKKLYFEVRAAKRKIMFANPLVDFDKIVLIDNPYPYGKRGDATNEWRHEARHRNGYMAVMGGKLLVVGLNPGGKVKSLFGDREGSFWRPDVHFSGKKIVVSFQPKGHKSFHLYEVDSEGKKVKQLTFGDYDDLDPVYTPDNHITFCSSRAHTYVRCMPMTHAYAVSRCDADGKNIYVVSRNGEAEYMASVLNDGRIIYTRWEYTDKALWRIQSLWTMNPDGTNVQAFWGNQSRWPDVLTEARAIPGSNRIMFTGLGHHDWFRGALGMIDPSKGLNYPNGLTKVTPEVRWTEVGDGPAEKTESKTYHSCKSFKAYKTPYPLSEEDFLCSASRAKRLSPFLLYLMDVHGNRELIYKGKFNGYYAMPLKARKAPPALPDLVKWPKIGSGEKAAPGILYSNDVFDNAPKILKGKGKYIRVVVMDPKSYTTWHKTVQHDGPAVSVFQADGVKRILGTLPIEKDGSICMKIPAGAAVSFQMLDEKKQCIHVMRSFTGVMPGEVRGCFGCHESKLSTRGNPAAMSNSIAIRKGAQKPVEPPWGYKTSISYARFVQPVLDKNCAKCHNDPKHKAYAKLNMTLRPSKHGWRTRVNTRPDDVSPFTEPYYTLVGGGQGWGGRQHKKTLSGVYIVESYNDRDGNGSDLKTLPPYSAFSPVSTLIKNASSGKHHKVKVSAEDLEKLVAWVDLNGPYLGDEEIRKMYDPVSYAAENISAVRPRVATAPVIDRFNIRQDGDSMKISGPLKLSKKPIKKGPPRARRAPRASKAAKKLPCTKIIKVTYGAGKNIEDVTAIVLKMKNKAGVTVIPGNHNDSFGDPINGTPKHLVITYELNGKQLTAKFAENTPVTLTPPAKK
jgi:hypothetical protein